MRNKIDILRTWIEKEISRRELLIDQGNPFYHLSAEIEAYQNVLDKIDEF
ncbi:MAG: hypothetical protein V1753_06905 [Pseudomonadota bacterium]